MLWRLPAYFVPGFPSPTINLTSVFLFQNGKKFLLVYLFGAQSAGANQFVFTGVFPTTRYVVFFSDIILGHAAEGFDAAMRFLRENVFNVL